MEPLPNLSRSPTRHSSSCASLSLPLLALLDATLPPPPALTLSVGCGAGLLEALLLQRHPRRADSLIGVEVVAEVPVIRYLPEQATSVVGGTWAVANEVGVAEGLMFVYPRSVSLVREYLRRGEKVQTVIWIGPRCDAEEFKRPLIEWGNSVEECSQEGKCLAIREGGGTDDLMEPGEMVIVARR
jgi:hypothetical protein